MNDAHFTEAQAWSLILGARDICWDAAAHVRFAFDEKTVEVARGGGWLGDVRPDEAARRLLDIFLPLVARAGSLCIAQLGQSLDGRIATASGASHYINGVPARAHLHRLRACVDAVVIGVGTLDADDPQLTVRHVEGASPVRVVLDPRGRARPSARLFHEPAAPVVHLVGAGCGPIRAGADHVTRLNLPLGDGAGFAPAEVLNALAEMGLRRVLVEGGGETVSRFVQAGAVDVLHLLVAPMIIGAGRTGLSLAPIDSLDEALRPACRVFPCGEDQLFALGFGAGR